MRSTGAGRPGPAPASPEGSSKDDAVFLISDAYAQTANAAAGDSSGGLLGMLPLLLIFGVMYFVMIRPQMKKQKEMRAMVEAVQKGDEVVTVGGILGRITKVGDNYFTLEIADKVEVQVQRSAVVQVLPKGAIKAS